MMKPLLTFCCCIIIYTSCTKHENCPAFFKIPAQLTPVKDEYHVGDTITITSKFHKDILGYNVEKKEIKNFDMSGITWSPTSYINRLDTMEHPSLSHYSIISKYFDFIEDEQYDYKPFGYTNGSSSLHGEYNFENDSFSLEIKLVLLEPGTFVHQLWSESLSAKKGQQGFPGKCNGVGFHVWVEMNNGEDNNIDMLSESEDTRWNTWVLEKPIERFYNHGGYCFRVVE